MPIKVITAFEAEEKIREKKYGYILEEINNTIETAISKDQHEFSFTILSGALSYVTDQMNVAGYTKTGQETICGEYISDMKYKLSYRF